MTSHVRPVHMDGPPSVTRAIVWETDPRRSYDVTLVEFARMKFWLRPSVRTVKRACEVVFIYVHSIYFLAHGAMHDDSIVSFPSLAGSKSTKNELSTVSINDGPGAVMWVECFPPCTASMDGRCSPDFAEFATSVDHQPSD